MDGIGYNFALAFSGTDLVRALTLALIGSLLVGRRMHVLKMTAIVFAIDRVLPFVGMATSGYGGEVVLASLLYQAETLPRDAVTLAIRFAGMLAVCSAGYHLRRAAHVRWPSGGKLPLPY